MFTSQVDSRGLISAASAPSNTVKFPDNTTTNMLVSHNTKLCWFPNCWRCGQTPEAVAIHSDCFELFKQEHIAEDMLDRLWTAGAARTPWRGASNLQLEITDCPVELFYDKAEKLGMKQMRSLPPELVRMIGSYSKPGTVWRYICVLGLARSLAEASTNPNHPSSKAISMPLCDMSAWTRGDQPKLLQASDYLPIIRLTIDDRGIRQIERLPHRPQYQNWQSDSMAFMIQEEERLKSVTAHLKYGILRLELPDNMRGFHVWDLANPPHVEDCQLYGHIAESSRFRTIDLCGTTGLTFFFGFSKVFAIHAHTAAAPYAKRTFDRLPKRRQADVSWIYLPIPKGEEITTLGARLRQLSARFTTQKPCFLVRAKLAGDVSIGPCHLGEFRDIVLGQLWPKLFIYNNVGLGPVTGFGTYSRDQQGDVFRSTFNPRWPMSVPFHHANFSSAPLGDVTRIQVLGDKELLTCRALIIDYKNGSRRAVGNCRLGLDAVRTIEKPSRICWLAVSCPRVESSIMRRVVRIECGGELVHHDHDHGKEGWVCSPLEGHLDFWFSAEESVVAITPE